MRFEYFTIPVQNPATASQELNRFLANHRILKVRQHLIEEGENSFWAVCVSYLLGEGGAAAPAKRSTIDYREVLSEVDFALFAKLRELRKELSQRDNVPAYTLFTNEQLAAMVTSRVTSLKALEEIDGVGASRAEKYGQAFLQVIKTAPSAAAQ